MANNKAYLACPIDGSVILVGKYYPTEWQMDPSFCANSMSFFADHNHAHNGDMFFGQWANRFPFCIVTEEQFGGVSDDVVDTQRRVKAAIAKYQE